MPNRRETYKIKTNRDNLFNPRAEPVKFRNMFLVSDQTSSVDVMTLDRKEWTLLNPFRTGIPIPDVITDRGCRGLVAPEKSCDHGAVW